MKNLVNYQDELFEMDLLRKRRGRAKILGFEDFIHKLLVEDLTVRLIDLNKQFDEVALVGPFLDTWANAIKTKNVYRSEDSDILNLKKNFDIIVHCLCLHWANDPLGKLIQLRRGLKPGGILIGYLFGESNLNELQKSFISAEISEESSLSCRVAPMMELTALGNLLGKAGFQKTVVDLISHTVNYNSLENLFLDLRRMGETSVIKKRNKKFLKRGTLKEMTKNYSENFASSDGKFVTTFNIICFTGWAKPSEI